MSFQHRYKKISILTLIVVCLVIFPLTIFYWLYLNFSTKNKLVILLSSILLIIIPIQYAIFFQLNVETSDVFRFVKRLLTFGGFFTLFFIVGRIASLASVSKKWKKALLYMISSAAVSVMYLAPIVFVYLFSTDFAGKSLLYSIEVTTIILIIFVYYVYKISIDPFVGKVYELIGTLSDDNN